MAITAADIHNASFSIDRKGYDVDEVDVFLERVADEIEAMNKQIIALQMELDGGTLDTSDDAVIPAHQARAQEPATSAEDAALIEQLRAQVASLQAQLNEKSANDAAISQALIVAQRSADEIIANARSEASGIVSDAEGQADRIVDKAESDRQRIIEAIRKLEADRNGVCGEYREVLADFMADAQRKLADIDASLRQASANSQARSTANAVSYAPVETLTASGVHVAGASVAASAPSAAPAGADPMQDGVPSETVAAPAVTSPSASGYIDKDFSGYGAADDDIEVDID